MGVVVITKYLIQQNPSTRMCRGSVCIQELRLLFAFEITYSALRLCQWKAITADLIVLLSGRTSQGIC